MGGFFKFIAGIASYELLTSGAFSLLSGLRAKSGQQAKNDYRDAIVTGTTGAAAGLYSVSKTNPSALKAKRGFIANINKNFAVRSRLTGRMLKKMGSRIGSSAVIASSSKFVKGGVGLLKLDKVAGFMSRMIPRGKVGAILAGAGIVTGLVGSVVGARHFFFKDDDQLAKVIDGLGENEQVRDFIAGDLSQSVAVADIIKQSMESNHKTNDDFFSALEDKHTINPITSTERTIDKDLVTIDLKSLSELHNTETVMQATGSFTDRMLVRLSLHNLLQYLADFFDTHTPNDDEFSYAQHLTRLNKIADRAVEIFDLQSDDAVVVNSTLLSYLMVEYISSMVDFQDVFGLQLQFTDNDAMEITMDVSTYLWLTLFTEALLGLSAAILVNPIYYTGRNTRSDVPFTKKMESWRQSLSFMFNNFSWAQLSAMQFGLQSCTSGVEMAIKLAIILETIGGVVANMDDIAQRIAAGDFTGLGNLGISPEMIVVMAAQYSVYGDAFDKPDKIIAAHCIGV